MILTQQSASVRNYWELLKPRVMSLVIFTGFCGMWMAPGRIHPLIGFTAILCIALGAGAAGCLNMWYERHIDGAMSRTKNRPTANGIIDADTALAFGIILSFIAVLLMQVCVNTLSAILLAITIGFYVVIYTIILKPNTPQNIVIGGLAGALPPVIGWASVAPLELRPLSLLLIIFLWTPAHFWALAINHMDDYAKANLPMMPNVVGIEKTKKQILLYAILTVISTIAPFILQMAGWFYLSVSLFFGIGFIYLCWQLIKSDDNKDGIKVFAFSILYLFLVFASLVIDKKEYVYG